MPSSGGCSCNQRQHARDSAPTRVQERADQQQLKMNQVRWKNNGTNTRMITASGSARVGLMVSSWRDVARPTTAPVSILNPASCQIKASKFAFRADNRLNPLVHT